MLARGAFSRLAVRAVTRPLNVAAARSKVKMQGIVPRRRMCTKKNKPPQKAEAEAAEAEEDWLDNLSLVLKFGCFLHLVHHYLFEVTMCIGPSMLPTFNDAGDIVLLERLTTRFNSLQRGDVVVAKSPTNPNHTVCKRVRAMEGDTVKVVSYYGAAKTQKIPKGYVWLEGDNPTNSTDSRHYGAVPQALVTGRVFVKIWPLSEFRSIGREPFEPPPEPESKPDETRAEQQEPSHVRAGPAVESGKEQGGEQDGEQHEEQGACKKAEPAEEEGKTDNLQTESAVGSDTPHEDASGPQSAVSAATDTRRE